MISKSYENLLKAVREKTVCIMAPRTLLVMMVIALLTIESRGQDSVFSGFCGNTFYKDNITLISKSGGGQLDTTSEDLYSPVKTVKPTVVSKASSSLENRLKREPVVIRLSIVYDQSMNNEQGNVTNYIRNLIYAVQLIYEQPEIYDKVKILLVVVSIKQSTESYSPNLDGDRLLASFRQSDDSSESNADLHVMLRFKDAWVVEGFTPSGRPKLKKILGIAYVGTFCNKNRGVPVILLGATTLGSSALTMAHELAHALNVLHDGESPSIADCPPDDFIMSPTNGPFKTRWSQCSVNAIFNYFAYSEATDCIYDENRLNNAKVVNSMFDFEIRRDNKNRNILPGVDTDIDAQCTNSLDKTAVSTLNLRGINGDGSYETCQHLYCAIGNRFELSIGAATVGSTCVTRDGGPRGKCFLGKCYPNY